MTAVADRVRSWRPVPTVTIRPIEPGDGERLRAFHAQLSPESRRLRFFSFHPHLSDDEVDRFVHVDGTRRAAFVATVGGEIVGVARYEGASDDDAAAEVAIIVRDDMQHQGIATALLDRLGAHAISKGIEHFTAITLPENERVRHLFRSFRSGTSSRFGDGVIDVTMPLGSNPGE
jgi:RimJ/RimL family protein N-acetyltransferase